MNAKSQNLPAAWVDPDDAPELTDAWFKHATWTIGDKEVTKAVSQASMERRGRGRPPSHKKVSTTIRFDVEVITAFKAKGDGWQTRMNDALKDWLRTHPL